MHIVPIQTRVLVPPQDDFFEALTRALPMVPERSILAVSSKAVSIGEGRCVQAAAEGGVRAQKEMLAQQEADRFVRRTEGDHRHFTIIHGSLMGSAGIDESNGDGHLILWPEDPQASAAALRARLAAHYGVSAFGLIITDSHSIPLHNGALGLAIAAVGFLPIKDYRTTTDLFGRPFKVERMNIADSLAAAATFMMGEGNEATPAALMTELPHVTWSDAPIEDKYLALTVPLEEDYFRAFLEKAKWEKGGGGFTL